MSQDLDISWEALRRIAKTHCGEAAELVEVQPLNGGFISTTVALTLSDHRKIVCKVSPYRVDRSYVNEAHQLEMLAKLGLPVPRVLAAKVGSLDDPFSYIVMDYVNGVDLHHARNRCTPDEFDNLQSELAGLMLLLHGDTREHYGRVQIDPPAPPYLRWTEFYRHVFDPIMEEAFKSPAIPVKSRKVIARMHDHLDRLLDHDDMPRLVHWDAWSANILVCPDESGEWHVAALLDPNCKYAHAEAELAYLTLFQTVTPAFMKAYQRDRRLDDGYHRVRKPVYQLYGLLNHVQQHGQRHLKDLLACIDRVGDLI